MMLLVRLLVALAALSFGAQPVLCAEMPLQPMRVASDPCHQMGHQSPQMPDYCPHQLTGMSTSVVTGILVPSLGAVSYLVVPLSAAPSSMLMARRSEPDAHLPFRLRTLIVDRTLLRI